MAKPSLIVISAKDFGNSPSKAVNPNNLQAYLRRTPTTSAWSLDGKLFAFTRGQEIRDVVLIRNLVPCQLHNTV